MENLYTVSVQVSGYVQIRVRAQDADEAAAIAEDMYETMSAEEIANRSDLVGKAYCVITPDGKKAYMY